jgi:small basic protein
MKNYAILFALLIGIAIGVAGTIYGPDYVKPYLPKSAKQAKGGIEGEVISKLKEQNKLLVTVKTFDGSILVTFTKKIPEINLLVEEGDIVNLKIRNYKPFISNPGINRVRKPDQKPQPEPQPKPEQEIKEEAKQPEQKPEQKKEEPAEPKPAEAEKPAAEEPAPVTNSAQ